MKVLVLLSLVAGAFAFLDCPANQHYDSCGTACPLTCENYKNPPKACVLMCVPGCHCDAGYVKAEDGSCVMPENCPNQSQDACGENERYNECGTDCPLTCDNYDNPPIVCNFMCRIGCECVKGYVRNANGKCVKPDECPRKREKNCHEELETGLCRGYFPMWYFDEASSSCKEFIYGGCGGNGNRYASKEECLRSCAAVWDSSSDVCDLPSETGMCRGYFPRFYFNKASGQCEKFVYGGCGGNENNFRSVDECQNTCGSRAASGFYFHCPANSQYKSCGTACPLTCENYRNPPKACVLMCNPGCHCDKGYVKTKDGSCVQPENCPSQPQSALDRPDCDKAPETGVCRAYIPRYYYDQQAGMCKSFIYGGCGGNRNNFESEDECYNKCGALAANLQKTCDQPKLVGPCRAAFRRFYFNKESGQCEKFIFGGCLGNDNNFNTKEDCEAVCVHEL